MCRFRSAMNWKDGSEHSAHSDLDNCYRDYAQRKARELADLFTSADAKKVVPSASETS
jgi:hypothetical protein